MTSSSVRTMCTQLSYVALDIEMLCLMHCPHADVAARVCQLKTVMNKCLQHVRSEALRAALVNDMTGCGRLIEARRKKLEER